MTKANNASVYIFPGILLVGGIVMLILYIKARRDARKYQEQIGGNSSGIGYSFLNDNQLNNLTTIKV